MEAIIVSPTPGPKAIKPQSNIENQSGSESTFAPTLDQAIKKNSSKQKASSGDSEHPHSAHANKESHTAAKGSDSAEDAAALAHGAHHFNTETKPTGKITAPGQSISTVAKETVSIVKNTDYRFVPSQGNSGSSTADFKPNGIAANQFSSSVVQQESNSSNNNITLKSNNESVVSAQFSQPFNGLSGISKEHDSSAQLHKPGNTVYLQNNDTISWNQPKTAAPNILAQNASLLQFSSEQTQSNSSSTIRVERFVNMPNELTAQGTTENTDKSLPLSVERLAARLTDMPVQANTVSTSLRENVTSLRQDPHEQFIEAKLEHMNKKHHAQPDQQSFSSDSDSTQKNALAFTPKNVDKIPESSFSQSLHTISTDKPTSSGVDTLRPGGAVFTHQIHENNILHQVLHKFRISQHLRDSRVVMKLHPAELGDLKIDVQLKDGSINANILAQSQQVQEILEKNMPRLKALMEEQGLVVNDISIKLDTDVSDNRNMFEDHLAQDENNFAKRKNVAPAVPFELEQEIIEDAELGVQSNPSGVNVMI
jgi:flagellar hook-length control protein FliK